MKIEVTIRSAFLKEFSTEEKQDRKTKKIIGGLEDDDSDFMGKLKDLPIEFNYRPYVLDSFDIIGFTPFDDLHTIVLTEGHGDLLVKMPYNMWKSTYEYISGQNVKSIQEAPTGEQPPKSTSLNFLKPSKKLI